MNSNLPLVSVVIPVYNGMPKIRLAISSLFRQTYSNWEAIIIDDGSSDGTATYLDELAIVDKRIKIHHFPHNLGRPYARQKALEMANGDFLAMLDADDFYAPTKLERQVGIMQKYPNVVLVSCGMCSWGKLTAELRIRGCGDNNIHQATHRTTVPHASSMLRMKRAKQYSYNKNLKYGQDQDFLQRYMIGESYFEMDEVLYYYSEFDSVNRKKIINTHWICFKNAVQTNQFGTAVVEGVKYVICSLIYPLLSDERVLLRRGVKPTPKQLAEFNSLFNDLNQYIV